MSDVNAPSLSREQKEFLEQCLTEFSNRFTEEDEDYKKTYDRGIPEPPIICPWHGRPRLTAVRSEQRNYQGRHGTNRYDSCDRDSRYNSHRGGYNHNRYKPY